MGCFLEAFTSKASSPRRVPRCGCCFPRLALAPSMLWAPLLAAASPAKAPWAVVERAGLGWSCFFFFGGGWFLRICQNLFVYFVGLVLCCFFWFASGVLFEVVKTYSTVCICLECYQPYWADYFNDFWMFLLFGFLVLGYSLTKTI